MQSAACGTLEPPLVRGEGAPPTCCRGGRRRARRRRRGGCMRGKWSSRQKSMLIAFARRRTLRRRTSYFPQHKAPQPFIPQRRLRPPLPEGLHGLSLQRRNRPMHASRLGASAVLLSIGRQPRAQPRAPKRSTAALQAETCVKQRHVAHARQTGTQVRFKRLPSPEACKKYIFFYNLHCLVTLRGGEIRNSVGPPSARILWLRGHRYPGRRHACSS